MSTDLITQLVRKALAKELRSLAANIEASVVSQIQQLDYATIDISAAPTKPTVDSPSSMPDWTNILLPSSQVTTSNTMTTTPPQSPLEQLPLLSLPPVYYQYQQQNSAQQPATRSHTIDQRLPVEIWHHVLAFLYPSQIIRLSRVNRMLYAIVASLNSWSRWFFRAHGPETLLYTLPGMPESKSYMLYMCAVSPRICERCFNHSGLGPVNPVMLPLPVHVPVPKGGRARLSSSVDYVGLPMNKSWTIRLCLSCRRKHFEVHEEHVPSGILGGYKTQQDLLKKYALRESDMDALSVGGRNRTRNNLNGRRSSGDAQATFSEESALQFARIKYGGNVGIWAAKGIMAPGTSDEQMRKRIDAYKTR
ncbi:hypothetical protein BGZ83_004095 [Gryganskiella cystojenkinii]|nr:hypothetical protein BGZ83_004095 [Gryganskiella cystojenkinii]